jgi:hypothetical protein
MQYLRAFAGPAVAAALLLAAGSARADFVNFSYAWSIQPAPVIPSGTGNVTFSLESGDSTAQIGGGKAVIPGASFQTSSLTTTGGDKYNTDFGLTLKLTEGDKSGELTFKGTLAGTLSASSSSVTVAFHNPTTQTLQLGGHNYLVTIGPMLLNVPAPGASSAGGKIQAEVRAVSAAVGQTPPPQSQNTPEPSGLILGVTALLGLGARRWARGFRRSAA